MSKFETMTDREYRIYTITHHAILEVVDKRYGYSAEFVNEVNNLLKERIENNL